MKLITTTLLLMLSAITAMGANKYDNPDTIFVARDGTAEFRNISEAIEVCRAFMEYHKVIYVKKGVYKEKLVIPSWLDNIEICGEDRDNTIITYDDHANIKLPETYRRRPSIVHQLPFPRTSGYYLHRQSLYSPAIQRLLYRRHYRLHLWSFYSLV